MTEDVSKEVSFQRLEEIASERSKAFYEERVSMARELLRLRSPTEARGEVKALEWVALDGKDEDGGYDVIGASSDNPLAHYWIIYADASRPETWSLMRDRGRVVGHYMEMAEAKAAAQADYSSRILSALSNPPAREAVDEATVEAGARAIDALWSEQQARHYAFEDTDREYQAHCRDTARAALLAALQVKP